VLLGRSYENSSGQDICGSPRDEKIFFFGRLFAELAAVIEVAPLQAVLG
jgi:hypothetical protein